MGFNVIWDYTTKEPSSFTPDWFKLDFGWQSEHDLSALVVLVELSASVLA